jgi:hypothetical protein
VDGLRAQASGVVVVKCQDLVRRPVRSVRWLAEQVGLGWSAASAARAAWDARPARMRRIMRTVEPGSWDPVTLVHRDHLA